jgi:hypothetical protein
VERANQLPKTHKGHGSLTQSLPARGLGQPPLEGSGAFRIYADPEEMLLRIEDLGVER